MLDTERVTVKEAVEVAVAEPVNDSDPLEVTGSESEVDTVLELVVVNDSDVLTENDTDAVDVKESVNVMESDDVVDTLEVIEYDDVMVEVTLADDDRLVVIEYVADAVPETAPVAVTVVDSDVVMVALNDTVIVVDVVCEIVGLGVGVEVTELR